MNEEDIIKYYNQAAAGLIVSGRRSRSSGSALGSSSPTCCSSPRLAIGWNSTCLSSLSCSL